LVADVAAAAAPPASSGRGSTVLFVRGCQRTAAAGAQSTLAAHSAKVVGRIPLSDEIFAISAS